MGTLLFIKTFFIAFLVFLGIDSIWLVKVAPNLYKENIGHLMSEKPNLLAAFIFYLIYIAALVIFVITPAYNKQSVIVSLGLGALFGLVTYATYDLTNLATLQNWPLKITIIDLLWGITITAATSVITVSIILRFFR